VRQSYETASRQDRDALLQSMGEQAAMMDDAVSATKQITQQGRVTPSGITPALCGFPLCRQLRGSCDRPLGLVAGIEQGQGGLGEVTFVGDLPFVVGFDED
jgi:hypothetical protein